MRCGFQLTVLAYDARQLDLRGMQFVGFVSVTDFSDTVMCFCVVRVVVVKGCVVLNSLLM